MNNKLNSKISLVLSINDGYAKRLAVTINSVLQNNSAQDVDFYILNSGLSNQTKALVEKNRKQFPELNVSYINIDSEKFINLKNNLKYISIETYYRYAIADVLPHLDKALYIDADLVVNGDLRTLWETDLTGYYAAGIKDTYVHNNNHRPKMFEGNDLYVNAGVLLLNLEPLRKENMLKTLITNTIKYENEIKLQDQDIINITFKNKIKELDSIYNFCVENAKQEKQKHEKAIIIHYNGQKKPWQKNCKHKLVKQYKKYEKSFEKLSKKLKVGIIINEFFGGAGTAHGGYGFLARHYIAKYIPNEEIQTDILIGKSKKWFKPLKYRVDDVDLYRVPKYGYFAKKFLRKQQYDVYLSVELVNTIVIKHEERKDIKLILWVQDPRPQYEWDEINTVKLLPEKSYYNQSIYDFVHEWDKEGRVRFISQGHFLNQKAKDLYRLPDNREIQYLPNPIKTDENFDVKTFKKKDSIVFLGRIDAVKRGWLFCEIAKQTPEYDFYMIGKHSSEKEINTRIMKDYQNIPNLHFTGHLEGEEKEKLLKEAKILVNTSIHEALPVSFLEALSYGTLLVSNRNPDDLTSNFGIHVGDVLGDGFDKVHLYSDAIRNIIKDDKKRHETAVAARKYIEEIHNIPKFIDDLRKVIYEEAL